MTGFRTITNERLVDGEKIDNLPLDTNSEIENIQVQIDSYDFLTGNIYTGEPGTDVIVTNVGTPKAPILDITIPRGFDGVDGTTNGTNGTSFIWKGTYSGATSYVVNDTVEYNGSSYICILASTGNIPTNATYFELMAQKGADGSGIGDMLSTNNLSDVADIPTARTNLGLGNLATLDTVSTTEIDNDAVTFPKIQNITTNRILGRTSAGNGDIEELTATSIPSMIGLGTSDSPQFAGVNIGHPTDTTITRVSAGKIAVEGNEVMTSADIGVTLQEAETVKETYTRDIICRVGTTANITLSGLLTIDGQVLVAGDYVLVKNQTTASQNGIYVVSATAWTRAPEYSTTYDFNRKDIHITSGTVNTGTWYTCYTKNPVIGTTSIVFALMATTIGTASNTAAAGNHTHSSIATTSASSFGSAISHRYTNRTATATTATTDNIIVFSGSTASQVETIGTGTAVSNNSGRTVTYRNNATVDWILRMPASNTLDASASDVTLKVGETVVLYNTALNTWITLLRDWGHTTNIARINLGLQYGNTAGTVLEGSKDDEYVKSIITGITGADKVTNIISLTQAEYDAILVKNASTFYIITS